jgi:hypothetical protein
VYDEYCAEPDDDFLAAGAGGGATDGPVEAGFGAADDDVYDELCDDSEDGCLGAGGGGGGIATTVGLAGFDVDE